MTSSPERSLRKTSRFARDIKTLDKGIQEEAFQIAMKLTSNPFHPELEIRNLTGFKGYYRVVVKHDFRMIYTFDDQNLYLARIRHRKDIYRKLEL